MRSKTNILDRSDKTLLKLPIQAQLTAEQDHLFLEVAIDIRDRLTLINSALQALNKQIPTYLPKPPKP